jgi:hypothetical protein
VRRWKRLLNQTKRCTTTEVQEHGRVEDDGHWD